MPHHPHREDFLPNTRSKSTLSPSTAGAKAGLTPPAATAKHQLIKPLETNSPPALSCPVSIQTLLLTPTPCTLPRAEPSRSAHLPSLQALALPSAGTSSIYVPHFHARFSPRCQEGTFPAPLHVWHSKDGCPCLRGAGWAVGERCDKPGMQPVPLLMAPWGPGSLSDS